MALDLSLLGLRLGGSSTFGTAASMGVLGEAPAFRVVSYNSHGDPRAMEVAARHPADWNTE